MKVLFTIPLSRSGGLGNFTALLYHRLRKMGVKVTHNLKDKVDVVLDNPVFKNPQTIAQKKKGAKILYRSDGLGATKLAVRLFEDKHDLSDQIVYQSEFCRDKVFEHYKKPKKGVVIYNGVSIAKLNRKKGKRLRILVYAKGGTQYSYHYGFKDFRDLLHKWHKKNPKAEIVTFGRAMGFNHMGTVPHRQLAGQFDQASLFIFCHLYDWCPNIVIEAMARGCPVICSDSGGTKELVSKDCRVKMIGEDRKAPGQFYRVKSIGVDRKDFFAKMDDVLANRKELGKRVRDMAYLRFNIDDIAKKYKREMEKLL